MDRERFEEVARALGLGADEQRKLWSAATTLGAASLTEEHRSISVTWDPEGVGSQQTTQERAGLAVAGREDRYQDLGPLGAGAMGEVRRVRDRDLNRVVAMKTLLRERRAHPRAVGRFLAEAQATAQLQHPGIVPVHEVGVLDDGRLYYTMREVRGRTLRDALVGVGSEGTSGLRRVVGLLRQAADAVGYAHSRGVVHRDLKPDNILVGEHGEVLVVDWGLARIGSGADEGVELHPESAVSTRVGTVAGTPAYMAPEQAAGRTAELGPRTDVWALGAMLYEVLSGRPPYVGLSGEAVLTAIRQGPPRPLAEYTATAPADLVAITERALSREPADRHEDGADLARSLGRWLDGSLQRQRALAEVARAEGREVQSEALREEARALRLQAEAALEGVPAHAPESEKAAGWTLLDQAAEAEERARLELDLAEQALRSALTHAPTLPEAHARLADRARAAWAKADSRGDSAGRKAAMRRLEGHLGQLPADHAARGEHAAFVAGTGALTLVTDPPGAHVILHRFVRENRRLVPRVERVLGQTPLVEVPLEPGSWLLVIQGEGRAPVHYPVSIGRAEHWDGVGPAGDGPVPIPLPTEAELGGACYVPPGWFRSGGDPLADSPLPARRLWCGGVVVDRFPVTVADYIAFLDDRRRAGGAEASAPWIPSFRQSVDEPGVPLVAWDGQSHVPVVDAEGDQLQLGTPITVIDRACVAAFVDWRAERDDLPWRLPVELEIEKARRGVDGRLWPFGDAFDPSWACVRESHGGARAMPVDVAAFPVDCSVYGVRGVAGNVLCMTRTRMREGPELDGDRVVQPTVAEAPSMAAEDALVGLGGLFHGAAKHGRCCSRYSVEPTARLSNFSFRLARTWPSSAE